MRESLVLLAAVFLMPSLVCAAAAEVVPVDPSPIPEPKTPPKPSGERPSLVVSEPDFKATAVFPGQAAPAKNGDATPEKNGDKRPWTLPEEEGAAPPGGAGDAGAQQEEQISPGLAKAMRKDRDGKPAKEMVAVYQSVVEAEPESAAARYRLGLALARSGEPTKGLEQLERAVALQPANAKYLCDCGLVALQAGEVEKAGAHCQRAVHAAPGNARYHSALGDCLLAAKRGGEAAEAYKRAIAIEPNNPEYIHNFGLVHLHAHAYKKAIEVFSEAIRLRPDRGLYYCNRGLAYENDRHVKEAIRDYTLAVAADRNEPLAHFLLANVQSDSEDPTFTNSFEALEHADRAVKLTQGRNAQYLMGLARALRINQRYDDAIAVARKAVELDPRDSYKKELADFEKLKTRGFK
jgi:tetratricopeptide (TPR) repeat protein